eukprot:scaffold1173_cov405-Prasinococcus_capsulatus_cf.AAC.11
MIISPYLFPSSLSRDILPHASHSGDIQFLSGTSLCEQRFSLHFLAPSLWASGFHAPSPLVSGRPAASWVQLQYWGRCRYLTPVHTGAT